MACMSLAVVHSRALDALRSPPVTVEVHLANGLPSFTLVGLADTEVKEARERVRAAACCSLACACSTPGAAPVFKRFAAIGNSR